jgi:hypothetical protein
MRKLIVSEFLSRDGVIQAPGGADEEHRRQLYTWRLDGALYPDEYDD